MLIDDNVKRPEFLFTFGFYPHFFWTIHGNKIQFSLYFLKKLIAFITVSMTNLKDCYHPKFKEFFEKSDNGDGDFLEPNEIHLEDLDHITSGHHSNSFTSLSSIGPNDSKRIDYIMFNLLAPNCLKNNLKHKPESSNFKSEILEISKMCKIERFKCIGKDPVSGISFSDHQPVSVKLNLNFDLSNKLWFCSSCQQISYVKKEIVTRIGGENVPGNNYQYEHEMPHVNSENISDIVVNEMHDNVLDNNESTENNLDFILSESGTKTHKAGPLQLKQSASCDIPNEVSSSVIKDFNSLERTKTALKNYLKFNENFILRTFLALMFLLSSTCLFLVILVQYEIIQAIWLIFIMFIIILSSISIFLLSCLHCRCEKNAIKSIIYEIDHIINITNKNY